MMEQYREMRIFVEKAINEPGSHGFDHTLRVITLCEIIGREEDAKMDILIPAAIFHDIARPLERKTGVPHEIKGAEMAEKYLIRISYGEKRISQILHAIKAHRFSTAMVPETLEAQILSDADKLDAMGAVGIARTFISAGERGDDIKDGLNHMHEKLLQLSGLLYTRSGKKMAEKRHEFLLSFVQALEKEIDMEINF
ncbi:HD domain-containing protein [Methanospirillum sp.]|uniref:HD domain-containing protein n=1 Tax=Methanospirillum sp. TaxID=45200 RepID=UPI0035A16361